MKNKQIKNLKSVVPVDIRIQVYKEIRDYFASDQDRSCKGAGLCLSLPVFLWGLSNFVGPNSATPEGTLWKYTETSTAFPELTMDAISYIMYSFDEDAARVYMLDKWIKDLEMFVK